MAECSDTSMAGGITIVNPGSSRMGVVRVHDREFKVGGTGSLGEKRRRQEGAKEDREAHGNRKGRAGRRTFYRLAAAKRRSTQGKARGREVRSSDRKRTRRRPQADRTGNCRGFLGSLPGASANVRGEAFRMPGRRPGVGCQGFLDNCPEKGAIPCAKNVIFTSGDF